MVGDGQMSMKRTCYDLVLTLQGGNKDALQTFHRRTERIWQQFLRQLIFSSFFLAVNKHKPWIETTYHGIVTENDDKVLLDPPLIALDKDAPLRYAGKRGDLMLPLFCYCYCHVPEFWCITDY